MTAAINQLHSTNVKLFSAYRELEGKLIDSIQAFDKARGFYQMGFNSLFSYCREGLGMSENQALTLIRVSRKAVEVPALKEAIIRKEITLSSAKLIAAVITPGNQNVWLEKAKSLTKPALERELVALNPKLVKNDRLIPLTPVLTEARGVLSEEGRAILQRVKEIESKRTSLSCDLNAAIIAMGKAYLQKNDPLEKAKRIKFTQSTAPQAQSAPSSIRQTTEHQVQTTFKPNRSIPPQIVHAVNSRDQGQCQANHRGKPCGSRYFPQIHHIRGFSSGGTHTLNNLVTLCSGHHRSVHLMGKNLELSLEAVK